MAVTQALRPRRAETMGALPITRLPNHVNHRVVTTAKTETAPAGAELVVIEADAAIWLSDGTAVVPASDVTDGTGSWPQGAYEAQVYAITTGQTISVISASGTANVSFRYYKWEDLG